MLEAFVFIAGIAGPSLATFGDAQVVSTWGKPDRERKAAGCIAISSRTLKSQGRIYAATGQCDGSIRILDAISGDIAAEIQCAVDVDRSSAPDDRAVDIGEDGSKAAFGSEGAELSIWDIVTQQRSYIAKGSKPNRIGLVDHPNNTAVAFIPGTDATKASVFGLQLQLARLKSLISEQAGCQVL
ncbi:hypothetical protein CVIRNUC_005416 [Coccomyxa viridis]|uniref:Uncharacterized protein n=1 Tax=Coccomyxa viridis TaxID=1274662 RepID=A0AAV1I4F6_9CHLO|nr:hypothetical protein CVIRNUC_005416 [Coccomyxa viridis]